MPNWESNLERWTNAGLIDAALAQRIRDLESTHGGTEGTRATRWPVIIAIVFGCVLVGAGVLLFVAAHWDNLSPAQRFALVLSMVAGFHLAAAFLTGKFSQLSSGLHGVGTIALGAGIFLSGQIFNLEEHWPGGIMLWALGAALAGVLVLHGRRRTKA